MPLETLVDKADSLAESLAGRFEDEARHAVAARGRFTVALPGGSVASSFFPRLARVRLDWSKVDFFWGDERAVPPDHPDSNYAVARSLWLTPAGVPDASVHRMKAEEPDLAKAAADYERELVQIAGSPPRLDLVLLGVGPDGHTASLFPGSPVLAERTQWARAVEAPTTVQPAVPRVTLTLPCLNGARNVLFLIAGNDKRPVVVEILEGGEASQRYPAAMIRAAGRTVWLVEQSAMPPRVPNT